MPHTPQHFPGSETAFNNLPTSNPFLQQNAFTNQLGDLNRTLLEGFAPRPRLPIAPAPRAPLPVTAPQFPLPQPRPTPQPFAQPTGANTLGDPFGFFQRAAQGFRPDTSNDPIPGLFPTFAPRNQQQPQQSFGQTIGGF